MWAKSLQLCPTLCNPMDYYTCQVLLSMEFSRQEYWSGMPCPLPGDLPDPGIELTSLNVSWFGRWVLYHSVQFSLSVVSDSLRPHESQHTRLPCPSPTPGVYSNSYVSSRWCYPAISSSVVPFSSCPQSLPASESFPMSQLFTLDSPYLYKNSKDENKKEDNIASKGN